MGILRKWHLLTEKDIKKALEPLVQEVAKLRKQNKELNENLESMKQTNAALIKKLQALLMKGIK